MLLSLEVARLTPGSAGSFLDGNQVGGASSSGGISANSGASMSTASGGSGPRSLDTKLLARV